MRVFDFNSAIVRAPGKSVVHGLRAGPGLPPSYEAVVGEHLAYIAALEAAGVRVTVLGALEQFPDSIFVEDPALVFSEAALLLRPGAPSRLAEARELRPALAARFPQVLELQEGHADGGDILVTPGVVLIGLSARTNPVGAAGLRKLLHDVGRASRVVEIPRGTLHLKTGCSLIGDETVLATRELAESGVLAGFRVLVVPAGEEAAANTLRVNNTVLVRAGCPRTVDMIEMQGLKVVLLDVAEIAKVDAGLSCLSIRWFDTGQKCQVTY